jgi:hypothetical protein
LLFNEPVNFVQELGQALNFIDNDDTVFGSKFLCHTTWVLTESQIGRRIEKIVEPHPLQCMANQKGFPRLARPQEEMRLFI